MDTDNPIKEQRNEGLEELMNLEAKELMDEGANGLKY